MRILIKIILILLCLTVFCNFCFGDEPDSTDTTKSGIVSQDKNEKEPFTNPAKMLTHILLTIYQSIFAEQDIQSCQFNPSCSQFSKEAYQKYDPIQATLMTSDRLQRCNPFAYQYYPRDQNGYLIDKTEDHRLW